MNTSTTSAEIAATIYHQLGGGRFGIMTGAKNLIHGDNGLRFNLPRGFAKNGINLVKVTLTEWDTYTVEFMKYRNLEVKTIATEDMVYADQLRAIFTKNTGLDCTF